MCPTPNSHTSVTEWESQNDSQDEGFCPSRALFIRGLPGPRTPNWLTYCAPCQKWSSPIMSKNASYSYNSYAMTSTPSYNNGRQSALRRCRRNRPAGRLLRNCKGWSDKSTVDSATGPSPKENLGECYAQANHLHSEKTLKA